MPDPEYYERVISLYTSSSAEKEKYAKLAEEAGTTLSKFLLAKVEESLSEKPKRRPAHEVEDLKEKVARLESENRLKDAEISQLTSLLGRQKNLAHLEDARTYHLTVNTRLINAIKESGPIFETRLLEIMGVDSQDMEMIRAISAQIELLERQGRIRKGNRGWRWVQ